MVSGGCFPNIYIESVCINDKVEGNSYIKYESDSDIYFDGDEE